MAILKPFRGCRFDPSVVGNLSDVICPPYDMIGPELKTELQGRSPYNAVHLEGGEQPDPVDPQAGYQQAAQLFRQWLSDGALHQDDGPCFYLMRHAYDFGGRRRQHVGLFADVLVEDYDAGGGAAPRVHAGAGGAGPGGAAGRLPGAVQPHHVAVPRLPDGDLQRIFDGVLENAPDATGTTPAGGNAELWRIADAATQAAITDTFANRPGVPSRRTPPLRGGAALQPGSGSGDGDAASNYVMMTLVEFDDPGLLLLPYHRVAGGMDRRATGRRAGVAWTSLFALPAAEIPTSRRRSAVDGGGKGRRERPLLRGVLDGCAANPAYACGPAWAGRSWGQLAVSEAWVLQERVLTPALGDALAGCIDYSPDHDAIAQQVNLGEQQMAILLKPFPLEPFRQIVSAGNRLPPKSTFFYPKLPTGLVINRLDGSI